jgi:hypothetical protein
VLADRRRRISPACPLSVIHRCNSANWIVHVHHHNARHRSEQGDQRISRRKLSTSHDSGVSVGASGCFDGDALRFERGGRSLPPGRGEVSGRSPVFALSLPESRTAAGASSKLWASCSANWLTLPVAINVRYMSTRRISNSSVCRFCKTRGVWRWISSSSFSSRRWAIPPEPIVTSGFGSKWRTSPKPRGPRERSRRRVVPLLP